MNFFNSKHILSEKRHTWVDYCRGVSIILVTYRHCYEGMTKSGIDMKQYPLLEYINLFFFGFRMPLFFIISGVFISATLQKNGLGIFAKKRFQTILYPMLVWGIIQITLQIAFSGYTNSNVGPESYFYLIADPRSTGQFWYLNALFCVGLLYAFFREVVKLKTYQQIIIGLIMFFTSNYINSGQLYLGFAIDIFKYYFFFALGDAISGFMLSEKSKKLFTDYRLFVSLLISFIAIQCLFTYLNLKAGNDYYVETNLSFFYLVVALSGTAFLTSSCFILSRYEYLKYLRVLGYNSISIFCMQIIVMSIARQVLVKLFDLHNVPLLTFCILISGLIIPVLSYNILLRIKLWWLFSLKKPEREMKALTEK